MSFRLVALRFLSLLALAVCVAMVVDYLRPTPTFCGFRAGCEEVIHSRYGRPLDVPLPLLGVLAFGLFFALTLFPASRAARLLGPLAITAGLIGLALVGVQFFILNQTCPFCLIVDTAAILLAAVVLGLPPSEDAAPPPRPRRWLWGGLAIIFVAAPVLWSILEPSPEVPPQVRAHWAEGYINVVEITDFGCPYCRQTHLALNQFLDQHGEQVHFVRLVVPLEHHENSHPAAKSYLCAVRQGKGESIADALFVSDDLSPDALQTLAEQAKLDVEEYHTCIADPAIDEQIEQTARWVEAADLGGLPQIWVQDVLLVGVQTSESLRAALRRAKLNR